MAFMLILSLAWFRLTGFLTEPRLADAQIHAITGEPSRIASESDHPPQLTLVTWNIERGHKLEAIATTLARLDSDLVLLQEVDRFCHRSGGLDIAQALAERLDMNWISAGEFQEIGEGSRSQACVSGQAILSRWPIDDAAAVRFGAQASAKWRFNPAQPRRGGRMALRARTAGINVYSLHLESGGGSARLRRRQVEGIRDDSAARLSLPTVVGGDFNNTAPAETATFDPLRADGFATVVDRAATEAAARRPIDWIFIRGIDATGWVERAEGASDHDPIVARVRRRLRAR